MASNFVVIHPIYLLEALAVHLDKLILTPINCNTAKTVCESAEGLLDTNSFILDMCPTSLAELNNQKQI